MKKSTSLPAPLEGEAFPSGPPGRSANVISKSFGHGEARERDACAGTRHFVHLTEDERGLVEHARIFHFVVEVVAFADALPTPANTGVAAVLARDIVDEFLNEYGLADACAAEEADFASL